MKIRELLSDESKWVKGTYAAKVDNAGCASDDLRAVRWCLIGALNKCYEKVDDHIKLRKLLVDAIDQKTGNGNIAEWNDAPERTFAEVKQLVEELDI